MKLIIKPFIFVLLIVFGIIFMFGVFTLISDVIGLGWILDGDAKGISILVGIIFGVIAALFWATNGFED